VRWCPRECSGPIAPDNDGRDPSAAVARRDRVRGRLPTLVPRDDRERRVLRTWRTSRLGEATIGVYLQWVRRFRTRWRARGIDDLARLTRAEAVAFARSYVGPRAGRRLKASTRRSACDALHAWSCGLQLSGISVPPWRSAPVPQRWPALVEAYGEYRLVHRGVSPGTLARDMEVATSFLRALRSRRRRVMDVRVADIDRFIDGLAARNSRRTVAGMCSALRCFLRFLRTTGRIRCDLASDVVAPRFRSDERPPRALPWKTIQRILGAIPRHEAVGRRDYAAFLLMATYGLGAGEVVRLQLEDVDWRAGQLHARRPKTDVPLELPLLPAVARALAAYLRRGRPRHAPAREVFVTAGLPHRSITSSALRHQVRKYAARVGVEAAMLGTHVFRHSYATRQIDAGAPIKIVGDILGHRRPASTSVYVRVALKRLRLVALPVPR
jgi:integrase/recombinase XerD